MNTIASYNSTTTTHECASGAGGIVPKTQAPKILQLDLHLARHTSTRSHVLQKSW